MSDTATPHATEPGFDELAQRVDRALAALDGLDATSKARAIEARTAIEAFHRLGLVTIVRTLKADERGASLLHQLAQQPEVYALLSMHGLIRADLATRVARVIEMVRPYMQSHGGDVELVEVRDRTAVVRLSGACQGCSMSAATLRDSVEEALRTHVAEIEAVDVARDAPVAGYIPLASVKASGDPTAGGWIAGPEAAAVLPGRLVRVDTETTSILIVRWDEAFYAFRNACAHQGLPLDGGMTDPDACTITCPWHGFRFDGRTGECLTVPSAQLEPFPLRIEQGRIYVRPA